VLIYPCLTDDLTADSYIRYAEAPVRTDSIDRAWDLYLGAGRPTRNGYAAPLKSENVSRLPPAHIHYAEFDCLAGGCWCDSVELSREVRADLLARHSECLCPKCLRAHAEGTTARG